MVKGHLTGCILHGHAPQRQIQRVEALMPGTSLKFWPSAFFVMAFPPWSALFFRGGKKFRGQEADEHERMIVRENGSKWRF